ncbi:MAG: septum site-determining protein MinC [Xenococcaceae cyanobacterium]
MSSDITFSGDDFSLSLDDTEKTESPLLVNRYSQVYLKIEKEKLMLVLPAEAEMVLNVPWSEIWQELKHRLQAREQSWQAGEFVSLLAKDQLLDVRQLQTIAETLAEVNLCLDQVCTSRRQTAVAAVTAGYSVDQKIPDATIVSQSEAEKNETQSLADPLYLRNTVRSGVEVRHPGTVVVLGDLNPGGIIIAAGDIFIWGRLRGITHAGANGNRQARILALKMEPTQLRIADMVARAPKSAPQNYTPEIAYIATNGIRLGQAIDFAKTHSFSEEMRCWTDSP